MRQGQDQRNSTSLRWSLNSSLYTNHLNSIHNLTSYSTHTLLINLTSRPGFPLRFHSFMLEHQTVILLAHFHLLRPTNRPTWPYILFLKSITKPSPLSVASSPWRPFSSILRTQTRLVSVLALMRETKFYTHTGQRPKVL